MWDADRARIVLRLPDHRLRRGAVISYSGLDGTPRQITLPDDAVPGRPLRLPLDDGYPWPRKVELVLLPLD